MTSLQKEQILSLHYDGMSFSKIAIKLDLHENTVKSFYKRYKNTDAIVIEKNFSINSACCQQCGIPIQQREKVKPRRFCSDTCRMAWWKAHQEEVDKKSIYNFVCANCNKSFDSYGNKTRKFCSRDCYFQTRFGG